MNCLLMREISVQNTVRMWDTYLVSAIRARDPSRTLRSDKGFIFYFRQKVRTHSHSSISTYAPPSLSDGARSCNRWIFRYDSSTHLQSDACLTASLMPSCRHRNRASSCSCSHFQLRDGRIMKLNFCSAKLLFTIQRGIMRRATFRGNDGGSYKT